jgi:hypothetical protein
MADQPATTSSTTHVSRLTMISDDSGND